MSAQKRKRMLIGFGALAVVLVAVIALVSPTFRSEDASGAIGAVQKHRETQIKPSDVILGSETARREAKVLYADYLTNAAKLQNLAVEIVAAAESLDDRAKLQRAEDALEAYADELGVQYVENLDAALMAMLASSDEDALGKQKLLSFQQEVDGIQARLQQKELADEEMLAFNKRYRAMADEMGSEDEQSLESKRAPLAAALASQAEAALNSVATDLESRLRRRALRRHYGEYLQAIALEARKVRQAEELLDSYDALSVENQKRFRNDADELAAALALQAQELEAHALANMKMLLQFDIESAAALARFSELVRNAEVSAEDRARLRSFDGQLESFTGELNSLAAFDAQDQFLALRGHLAVRDAYEQRLRGFEGADLAAFQLANADAFGAQLANLDVSVAENRVLANAMPNAEDFAAQVRAVMNRAR